MLKVIVMLFDNMFVQNDLLGTAMQASVVRNDVISNNIANAETPGFKKSDVSFDAAFQQALDNYKKTGQVDLSSLKPVVQKVDTGFSYRIDENNVDIESEMVNLYQNSVKYDVLASGVMNNYKNINLVLASVR